MFGNKRTATIDGPLTHETLRAWLVAELARRVKCAESEVDTAKPFDAYGLDSRHPSSFRVRWKRSSSVDCRRLSCSTTRQSMSRRLPRARTNPSQLTVQRCRASRRRRRRGRSRSRLCRRG